MSPRRAPIKYTVDQRDIQLVARVLKEQAADGKILRSALTRDLRAVMSPLQQEVKQKVLAMPTTNSPADMGDLRNSISEQVKVTVRYAGRNTGAALVVKKSQYPRGFTNAPRRFNAKSFRHRVFGRDAWVTQVGVPDWFDGPVREHQVRFRAAAMLAVTRMAEQLAARTRGR